MVEILILICIKFLCELFYVLLDLDGWGTDAASLGL